MSKKKPPTDIKSLEFVSTTIASIFLMVVLAVQLSNAYAGIPPPRSMSGLQVIVQAITFVALLASYGVFLACVTCAIYRHKGHDLTTVVWAYTLSLLVIAGVSLLVVFPFLEPTHPEAAKGTASLAGLLLLLTATAWTRVKKTFPSRKAF